MIANFNAVVDGGIFCGFFPTLCIATEDTEKNKEEVAKQESEADARLPSTAGETICALSVFVDAQLIEEFTTVKIRMDESNPADYQWHCQFPSLISWIGSQDFTPFFFALESEFIHTEIVLIDKNDKSKKYDANHPDYKEMFREIRLTDTTGFIATPLNMDQTFYVDNIVHGDYILEIYYGRIINNNDAGEPVIDSVCMVGKHTC